MVSPVEETMRVYTVVTDRDDAITVTAVSDNGTYTYEYAIDGLDGVALGPNDTEYLIEVLKLATDWINENAEKSE